MQAAASIADPRLCFGTELKFASGAETGARRDETTSLYDAISRATIDHQIADQRK